MLLQLPMAPATKFVAVMDPKRSRATPLPLDAAAVAARLPRSIQWQRRCRLVAAGAVAAIKSIFAPNKLLGALRALGRATRRRRDSANHTSGGRSSDGAGGDR